MGERDVAVAARRRTSGAELDELYAGAAAAGRECAATVRIAGHRVELRCADARLYAALSLALRHLTVEGEGSADLVVRVWDGGRQRPAIATEATAAERWKPGSTDAFGPSYYGSEATLQTLYQPVSGAFSAFDADAGRAWYWVRDAELVPFWDRAAPLRHVFGWYLAAEGLEQVHAGAVGTADGGVLIVGKSGSGKSTATLAAAVFGRLPYAGDDYVAVGEAGGPFVHSLYCSAKLEPDHLQRFPDLLPVLVEPPDEGAKAVAYVGDDWAGGLTTGFPLRAAIVPQIGGPEGPVLRPISTAAALTALAPSTLLQVHPARSEALVRMANLLRRVPAYALQLDGDVSAAGRAIADLLSDLRRGR